MKRDNSASNFLIRLIILLLLKRKLFARVSVAADCERWLLEDGWMVGSNVKLEHLNGRTDGWMDPAMVPILISNIRLRLLAPISTSYPVDWFSCCLFWLQLQLFLFYLLLSSFFWLMNKLQMLQIFQNFRRCSLETNHPSFGSFDLPASLCACLLVEWSLASSLTLHKFNVRSSHRVVAGRPANLVGLFSSEIILICISCRQKTRCQLRH